MAAQKQSGFILPYKNSLPKIDDTAFIAPSASIIGDVEIGADSQIWYGCTVRGDVNDIKIGARTNIQDGSVIHVTHGFAGTHIGDDVTVGHNAVLHACTVHDKGFVGMQACVMDGAIVESYGMVAAGALVSPGKIVKSGELWVGRPARCVRELTDEERKYIDWSAPHYVVLGQEHKKSCES